MVIYKFNFYKHVPTSFQNDLKTLDSSGFFSYSSRLFGRRSLSYPSLLKIRRRWPALKLSLHPPARSDDQDRVLRDAVLAWEEFVRWIVNSYDCWEEYEYSVWHRITVQQILDCYAWYSVPVPRHLLQRLSSIDRAFRQATFVGSKLIVDYRNYPLFLSGSASHWWFLKRFPLDMPSDDRSWYATKNTEQE